MDQANQTSKRICEKEKDVKILQILVMKYGFKVVPICSTVVPKHYILVCTLFNTEYSKNYIKSINS